MDLTVNLKDANDIDHIDIGLQPTPFHSRTSKMNINQQWTEWCGYATATSYIDAHIEYFATRNTCAVFFNTRRPLQNIKSHPRTRQLPQQAIPL